MANAHRASSFPSETLPLRAKWRRRCVAAAGLAGLLAGGCRSVDNAQVDLLERELRQQEDYIYELENNVLTYAEKLRECRCANPSMSGPGAGGSGANLKSMRRSAPEPTLADEPKPTRSNQAKPKPAAPEAPEFDEPAMDSDEGALPSPADEQSPAEEPTEEIVPEELKPENLDVPELEIGPTSDARPLAEAPRLAAIDPPLAADEYQQLEIPNPAAPDAPPEDGSELLAAAGVDAAAEESETPTLQLAAAQPADGSPLGVGAPVKLSIARVLRGEPDAEGAAPDSLFVVVEALDRSGSPVVAIEQTSLMLLREDAPGSLEAIRRWDFSREEAEAAWQESALGTGLHFELPLHGTELPAGPLQAWSRIVTADGAKLLAKTEINAAQLASLDEALDEAPPTPPVPAVQPKRAVKSQASATTTDGPAWRKATGPVGPLSQGYASTAGGAWSSSAADQVQPAMATRPMPPSKSPSTGNWQRRSDAKR